MQTMLQIIAECNKGGAEKHTKLIAQQFAKMNFKVILVFPPGEYSPYFKELQSESVECIERPIRLRLSSFLWLRKIYRQKNVTLVHSHMHTADILSGFAAIGLPNVIVFSTIHYLLSDLRQPGIKFPITHLLNILSFLRMNKIFTVSEEVRKKTIKLFKLPKSKCVTTLNSINFNEMNFESTESHKLKTTISENNKYKLIVTLGTLTERKGQHILLKVLKNWKGRPIKLVFIGEGPDEIILKSFVQDHNLSKHVLFAGFQDNIPLWLSIADVYCQLSTIDPLPRALLEAMYLELKIVASNINTISEVIHNNINGLLVNPTNTIEISNAINSLLSNKEDSTKMGLSAKQFILKNCSMETMASKILDSLANN